MFRVGVSREIQARDGSPLHDLSLLDSARDVEWEFLPEGDPREAMSGYDALIVFASSVTREMIDGSGRLVHLARLGVGYDRVDVEACTERGVLLTITPDGVRGPMASAAMAFVLSLAHRIAQKNREVRVGQWDQLANIGSGHTGRTLGLIGLGNLGHEVARLASPFGFRLIAADPFVRESDVVTVVDLPTLLRESDFVVVVCPLTEQTYRLIGPEEISLMKETAFLVNVARGGIVDEVALAEAVQSGRLAGAGLDVFEEEPIAASSPLLALDNVLLTPHSVGHTDELFQGVGMSASQAVVDVAAGRVPKHVVNAGALEHPRHRSRRMDD